MSINNLALLLDHKGDYAAAEGLHRRALAARERVLAQDHPDTLTSVDNLAGILGRKGDYVSAEALYRRGLLVRERVLGLDHPHTLISVNNLAVLLYQKGDYAAAEPLFRRILAASGRTQGPDHPSTLMIMNNLAGLLGRKRDYAAADAFYCRALSGLERALGPNHKATADTRASLARLRATALAFGEPSAAREAARSVWAGNDAMLELTITVLGSCGETPSGIEPDDGKRGAEFLRDSCPASRKAIFQRLAVEAFGPATAGIPGRLAQPVTLKHGGLKKIATGQLENVQVYAAANKLDALRFLESRKISREPLQFPKEQVIMGAERMTKSELDRIVSSMPEVAYEGVHRFIVETPEGKWGKDNSGLYRIG